MGFDRWYMALDNPGSAYLRTMQAVFGPGQYVGQQGLCTADDILELARKLGVGPGRRLLDLCCGPGGPGALIAASTGCTVVGLDRSMPALQLGLRRRESRLHFAAADVLCLPTARSAFHAALVLDSLVSIHAPGVLLHEIGATLVSGGRLALTAEVGEPLGPAELGRLTPGTRAYTATLQDLLDQLRQAGLRSLEVEDQTPRKAALAGRMADRLVSDRGALSVELDASSVEDVTATISTWADMLARGRLRALLVIAERPSQG